MLAINRGISMPSAPFYASSDYQPANTIEPPAVYSWPPKPIAALKYLLVDMLFSWNLIFIGLAALCWTYLAPTMTTMASFEFSWIAMIWLRNAAILTLIAGGLHWWLYMRRSQNQDKKVRPKVKPGAATGSIT